MYFCLEWVSFPLGAGVGCPSFLGPCPPPNANPQVSGQDTFTIGTQAVRNKLGWPLGAEVKKAPKDIPEGYRLFVQSTPRVPLIHLLTGSSSAFAVCLEKGSPLVRGL